MIDDYEIIELLDLHAICRCVIAEDRHTKGVGPYSCTVSIKNQVVAIDCDKCQAFTQNDRRPDILCIQCCDHELGSRQRCRRWRHVRSRAWCGCGPDSAGWQ